MASSRISGDIGSTDYVYLTADEVIGNPASERLDASDRVTPLFKRFPSHGDILLYA